MTIFTALQHTRFILPPFHPAKSSLRCVGGIFFKLSTLWQNKVYPGETSR